MRADADDPEDYVTFGGFSSDPGIFLPDLAIVTNAFPRLSRLLTSLHAVLFPCSS
jgi:hypothetical protein